MIPTRTWRTAICLLASAVALGQGKPISTSTEPSSKNGTIRGRVLAADTGLGLSKASITVFPQDGGYGEEPRVVRTNEHGHFEVSALKTGKYLVNAARPGYLSQFYGQKSPGFSYDRTGSTPLNVGEGQILGGIDFRLVRYGIIEGKVVDASGEPMVRAMVQLSRYANVQGGRRLISPGRASIAHSDDRGYFRLFEIPPGSYYLHARRDGMQAGGDGSTIPPTYYPGVLDPQEATRIEVVPGAELQGLELTLLEVRGFNVSGRVVAPEDRLDLDIFVSARRFDSDGNLGAFSTHAAADQTGSFTLRSLIPGKYLVTARSNDWGPNGPKSNVRIQSGTRELEVSDSDLAAVTIAVGYGGEINGSLTWPGDSSALDLRKMQVIVSPEDSLQGFNAPQGGDVTRDLRFSLKGVSEGRIRLRVELPPGPHYVKSIRMEGREVVDQSFEIHNNDVLQVAVIIADDGAELVGTAKTEGPEAPAKGVTVVALAERAELRSSPRFRRRSQTDQEGKFSIRGLPPGSYLVAAVSALDHGGENDPEFLKSFENTAQRVELSAGRVYNETLTVTSAAAAP